MSGPLTGGPRRAIGGAAVVVVAGLVASLVWPVTATWSVPVPRTGPPEPAAAPGPLGGTCAPVDVALVLDTTTSMDPAITQVKEQLVDFLDVVETASGGDYRLGLVDFGRGVTVHVPFADGNRAAVAAAIPGLLQSSGNSGDPEAWDEALSTVVHNRAAAAVPENVRRWHQGDFTVPWRPEANRLVVVVTDARAAGWDDDFDPADLASAEATARDAAAADIKVSTIFVPNYNSEPDAAVQLRNVAGLAGGSYAETLEDGANLKIGLDLAVRTCGADTDGDGLFDQWESDGIDHDGDGTIDVDLAAMGADPRHKDLFVQVSWMVSPDEGWCTDGGVCIPPVAGFSPPSASALERVGDAFARASVTNPDGQPGVRVHFDAGPSTPEKYEIEDFDGAGGSLPVAEWADPLFPEGLPDGPVEDTAAYTEAFSPATDLQARWVPEQRRSAFTFVLYTGQLERGTERGEPGTLGVASGIPSDMIVVAKRHVTSVPLEAMTVMHELGHTLGLGHGGPDDLNYKPNYLSIMNYGHAERGGLVVGGDRGLLDYSRWHLAPLPESRLEEPAGITVTTGPRPEDVETVRYCAPEKRLKSEWDTRVSPSDEPIDWNCDGDGTDTGISRLLVPGTTPSRSPVEIVAWNDWANLSFTGGVRGGLASDPDRVPDEDGFDAETYRATPKPYAVEVAGGGRVSASPDADDLVVAATVTNSGEEPDTYEVALDAPGVEATLLTDRLELAPGASAVTGAGLVLDNDVAPGDEISATISVTSTEDPDVDADATFTLAIAESPDPPPATEALHLDPSDIAPGGTTTVTGEGFTPGTPVAVVTRPRISKPLVVAASRTGDIEAEVTVQDNAAAGTVEVSASGTRPGSPTGAPTSPPTTSTGADEDDEAPAAAAGPYTLIADIEIESPPSTPDPKSSGNRGAGLLVAMASVMLAAIAIVWLVLRRPRRHDEERLEPGP